VNICFLPLDYPSISGGGRVGNQVRTLGKALAQAGHRVTVVSFAERGAPEYEDDSRVHVHRIRAENVHWCFRVFPPPVRSLSQQYYHQGQPVLLAGNQGGMFVEHGPQKGDRNRAGTLEHEEILPLAGCTITGEDDTGSFVGPAMDQFSAELEAYTVIGQVAFAKSIFRVTGETHGWLIPSSWFLLGLFVPAIFHRPCRMHFSEHRSRFTWAMFVTPSSRP
jgi:hypothetical protein